MAGRRKLRTQSRALVVAAAAAAAALLRQGALPGSAFVPAWASTATADVAAVAADVGTPGLLPELDLAQILLADDEADVFVSEYSKTGGDLTFYGLFAGFFLYFAFGSYVVTKPYWETRWLVERINNQKFKFITDEENTDARDKYKLGRLYGAMEDYSGALAEYEEAEDEMGNIRPALDPEDAMGALAARAMLHNSKGYSLMRLEPPRTAQARREFVRAVTYWPEYPEALYNIGCELMKRKRWDVAVRTLNTALKWQPGSEYLQNAASEARKQLEIEEDETDEDEYEYIDAPEEAVSSRK